MRVTKRENGATRRLLSGLSTAVLCISGTALSSAALPSAAFAQDTQTAAVDERDEIIVTARRRAERLQDAPVAITALSQETLETYNANSIGDITSFVPSMVVGRQVTGSSASIFLRGVGSTSLSAGFDQSVSFNLDGLAMSRGRELLFSQYDVQGVEVLKGPQALYFGRNTTGGLISVTTNGPTDEFEAQGRLGYGFEAEEIYGEGVISGPLSDVLGARFAFRVSDSEGAFDNTAEPAADGPPPAAPAGGLLREPWSDRRGASESFSGRLTVDFHPSDAFNVIFKGGMTDYSDDGAGTLYERVCGSGRTTPRPSGGVSDPYADCSVDGRSPHSAMPIEVLTPDFRWARDGVPYTELTSEFAIVNATYDFGSVALNSITGYYHFKQEDLNDFLGATRTNGVTQHADFNQFSQELRLSTQFDGPVHFTTGLYYADSELEFDTDVYIIAFGLDPVRNTYTTFRRDNGFEASTLSLFGEATWNITPEFELSGGARWSRDERDSFEQSLIAHSSAAGTFPQNVLIEDTFSDENVSPQISLAWRPNRDVSFYAAYKEGYKTGGFNVSQTITAACTPLGPGLPNRCLTSGQFTSETAGGWETGVRSTLFDGQLRFNATFYDYTYEDLQVQFYNPVTSGQVVANAGELNTRGVEMDFSYMPAAAEGLSFNGAIAYNNAEYDNFIGQCYAGQTQLTGCDQQGVPRTNPALPGGANNDTLYNGQVFSGRTPPKAPEWATRFGGAYEFNLTESVLARFTLDAGYTSEYNYSDTLRPDAVQDSFTRIDASVALIDDAHGWTLSLIGRNLTDELIIATANDMTGTGAGTTGASSAAVAAGGATITPDMNAIIERPREIYLELGFKF